MTEITVNLNSIIKILKRHKGWHPDCSFRIAAWETFGRKVTRGSAWEPYYKCIIEEMNRAKDLFTLADDPLYYLLKKRVVEDGKPIVEETANEMYRVLVRDAEDLKMKSFADRYPTVKSLSVKISHINNELSREFDFKKTGGSGHKLRYNFDRLDKDEETANDVPKDVSVLTENQQLIANLKAQILAKEKEEAESK